MKNEHSWTPSKFTYQQGRLKASRDPKQVGIPSRIIADLIAGFYNQKMESFVKGDVLDLGCGKVPLYQAYRPFAKTITCVDWENSLHQNDFLDSYADLNAPMQLASDQYDAIILSDVLEHIKEPKVLFKEMNRVLKTDGILLLNVPFFYSIHEEPHDYHRYTKYALQALASESGFEVIEIEPLGGAPEVLADILGKVMFKIPYIGKFCALMIQKITSVFLKTKPGAMLSKKTQDKFPIAYGMIAKKI